MTRPLVIVGCAGLGREVVSIVAAVNAAETRAGGPSAPWEILGFVDDAPTERNRILVADLGLSMLGAIGDIPRLTPKGYAGHVVVAVGWPRPRSEIVDQLADVTFATLVHPDATLGRAVELGVGTIVAPGARLSTQILLGDHCQIDQNATIGHDTTLGSFVRVNPTACVSGDVTIGDRTLIGANSTVLQGLTVGSDVIVGAGAVVVSDVPDGVTVKGVPAR